MNAMFDRDLLEKIRVKFPRAVTDLNGRKRAFFDNGTGTLVVAEAGRAEAEARVDCSTNVGAGFDESKKAEAVILDGRKARAFKVEDKSDEEVVGRLWTDGGIAARVEDFYSRAMESCNQQTMIRISLVHYNTLQEIALFLETLSKICKS